VIASDDRQAPAMVAALRDRGVQDVLVLDDASGSGTYGLELASYFARAARSGGLDVVGRASWARRPTIGALARRVARARPGTVYVSGALNAAAGEVVRAAKLLIAAEGR
jgi:hypothetical protein